MTNFHTKEEVRKCFKCKEWIGFLDDAIGIEIGRMGGDWSSGSAFITYSKETGKIEERFYHKSCYNSS